MVEVVVLERAALKKLTRNTTVDLRRPPPKCRDTSDPGVSTKSLPCPERLNLRTRGISEGRVPPGGDAPSIGAIFRCRPDVQATHLQRQALCRCLALKVHGLRIREASEKSTERRGAVSGTHLSFCNRSRSQLEHVARARRRAASMPRGHGGEV